MQSLTSVIIRIELSKDLVFNTRKFQFERQRNSLKAYKLKHSYYNHDKTRFNVITTRFRNIKTIHDTIVAWHEDVLSSQPL
jgi:hypothetical protein